MSAVYLYGDGDGDTPYYVLHDQSVCIHKTNDHCDLLSVRPSPVARHVTIYKYVVLIKGAAS
jgi:hypothetical protein